MRYFILPIVSAIVLLSTMIQKLSFPLYATEAGGEFGAVCFVVSYTGTAMSMTGTGFLCARTIDIVMRAMGHGG
jgi:hypothetical protein